MFVHAATMYWLTVDHLDHMAFLDAHPGSANASDEGDARIHAITTRYVLDFFGHHLSDTPASPGLDRSPFAGTELRVRR